MGGRSDEDKSCTGPGGNNVTREASRGRSKEKESKEKIDDTQAGGETTRGDGVTEGRDATKADATQATEVTEGNRSATGPLIVDALDKRDDTKRMDEMLGTTTKGEDTKGKPMGKLDITALNSMERSQGDDDDQSFETWAFWRKKKRRKRGGKRKRTKGKRRRTRSRATTSRATERTRNVSVTSKPSKKEVNLNPFRPGGFEGDTDVFDTTAATTKGDGPGLETVIMKNEKKHQENEQKYRQLILEQRDDLARMRAEINQKEEQLADAEAHRKRGIWNRLTGTYLAKTISSVVMMVLFYGIFVAIIGSLVSMKPFDEKFYDKPDW